MIRLVVISKQASKDLRHLPIHIIDKLFLWKRSVEELGLEEVRKISGYHDEPLKGERSGERSIRLSKAYRAIYIIDNEAKTFIKFVSIEEVTHHEY